MKRVRIEYTCDECGAPVEGPGIEDFTGHWWSLCDECEDRGYRLRVFPLDSGPPVVRMFCDTIPVVEN